MKSLPPVLLSSRLSTCIRIGVGSKEAPQTPESFAPNRDRILHTALKSLAPAGIDLCLIGFATDQRTDKKFEA